MGVEKSIAAMFATAACVTAMAADDAERQLAGWRCRTTPNP